MGAEYMLDTRTSHNLVERIVKISEVHNKLFKLIQGFKLDRQATLFGTKSVLAGDVIFELQFKFYI